MESHTASTYLALVGLVTVVVVYTWLKKSRLPLPPGPKGWPILGNALDMPTKRPWEKYHEWSKTYDSDVIYLQFPTGSILILDTLEAVQDLFEKKSQIYSDRMRSLMVKLLTWDFNFAFLPYGPEWRACRKMFHQHFQPDVVGKYRPIQLRQARALLGWILESPRDTAHHIRRMGISTTLLVTYGKHIKSLDDPYLHDVKMAGESFNKAAIPGEHLIEMLPFLLYIPGAAKKSLDFVKEYKPYVVAVKEGPYAEVKTAVDAGTALPSMARSLIEDIRAEHGGTEDEAVYDERAKGVTNVAYTGGVDSTNSTGQFFLLAMALFPRVQKKAQAELHAVVGPNRLPDFNDIDNLPYLQAVIMETWRWMPVAPVGLPHGLAEDDIYKGYRIPKYTLCFANIWAMTHNPADYPDPDQFKPERFIGPDGRIDPSVRDPTTIAFGFGRRKCPGVHFVTDTITILAASLLHVFDIAAGVDVNGNPNRLGTDIIEGLVPSPKDVPCGLTPRSNTALALIHEAQRELEV